MATKFVCAALLAALCGVGSTAMRALPTCLVQDPKPAAPAAPQEQKAQHPQSKDRPAPPPADAPPLKPIEEPYIEPVQRGDLPERYGARDPIEGLYSVRARFIAGQPVPEGKGYMVIGRRHIMVHFEAPGPNPRIPSMRAQVFTWSRADNAGMVRMVGLVGHGNEADGDWVIEEPGTVQMRRFEARQGVLRVHQDGGSWIDFVRVE
ncbi:MAG: hypothetical protein RLZZ562_705 [Planctomycetota bacterium]|jgi:hypothetical protein